MFCPLFFVVVGFLAMHGSEGREISPSPQVFPADPIGNAAASPPVSHGNLRSANAPSSPQFPNTAPPPTISPSKPVSTEPRIPNIPPSISPSTPSQLPKKHEGSVPSSPAIKNEPPTSPPVTDSPPTSISSPPPIPPIPKETSNETSGDTQAPINSPVAPALPLPAKIPVKPPTPHPPVFAPPPVSTGLPSKDLPRVAPSPKEIIPPAKNDTNNASPTLAPTHDVSPPTNKTNNVAPAEAPSKDISSQLSPPTHSPITDDNPPSSSVSSPPPVPPITRGADNGTSPGTNGSMGSAFVPVPSPPLEIPTKPPAAQPNISVPPPLPIESSPNNDLPPQSNIFAPPPLAVGLPHNNDLPGPSASPTTSVFPALNGTHNNVPAKAPSKDVPSHLLPPQLSPIKGIAPVSSPKPHKSVIPSSVAPTPLISRSRQKKMPDQPPAFPPLGSDQNSGKKDGNNKSSTPTNHRVPVVAPVPSLLPPPAVPKNNQSHKAFLPIQGPSAAKPPKLPVIPKDSPAPPPLHAAPSNKHYRPALAPEPSSSIILPAVPSNRNHSPLQSPVSSPVESPPVSSPSISLPVRAMPPQVPPAQSPKQLKGPKQLLTPSPAPAAKLRKSLPPPPPNLDCTSMTCMEPLTNNPPGSPCACVQPMKVGLRLSVALYTFFPLVSELAQEIASGTFMKQSQVRIMGANAATEQPDKTIVLVDLVPLGQKFDRTTSFLTSERFWHKQVGIKTSYFGDYDVLYVMYPGLPPSPPMSPLNTSGSGGSFGNENNSRRIHPLGVDVRKRKEKLGGSLIAIIILSSVIALVLSVGIAWFLFIKPINRNRFSSCSPETPLPLSAKALGMAGNEPVIFGSCPTSASASFGSNVAPYSGSAKTFSAAEIEKATNKLDHSRVIGEGGFGRVYEGILEDSTKVAVKVLKRDDHQGSREFLAEVEMLSRLHHRNLVKLIGICTEEHLRCLVYELIPNGSVESHLHGADKEIAPLDWSARIKIALGSARGLAYLHEDSNPRVIHRDFKSSNILLENDFTPKVSDFGLARTALDDGNRHISTRVMGTFGYVAPEYAMTGHLLVKSDVYSYGVVLLELLTGRKPVNMSQPPGQENLVTWARPLLTSREDLEMIIDPALGSDLLFDSVAKVAAIASMCVQPEVSHRPFMGEVVQALKLVCNENDEHRPSESGSQADAVEHDPDMNISGDLIPEGNRVLSASDIFSTSAPLDRDKSGSFRRHSSSGPIRTSRSGQFWSRLKGFSRGSVSEHGGALRSSSSTQRWP